MARLPLIKPDAVDLVHKDPVDDRTLEQAAEIVAKVRNGGDAALRALGERFGDIVPTAPMVLDRTALKAAVDRLSSERVALLERTADRIRRFAEAQFASVQPIEVDIEGGRAGHTIAPVTRAGCYAPGGRFPLPSSVLMTAVTAKTAGVAEVWVASPCPVDETKAAAYIAGADALLCIGGAQAIAALVYGTAAIPPCDIIVGPGNRFVTAAKSLVAGRVAIDMLAGPSELVVLADDSADPATVAADLLAQAEHDPDARPILIATDRLLIDAVNNEIEAQLQRLGTRATAELAVANGFAVFAEDETAAAQICDAIAPEHLEVMTRAPEETAKLLHHYGALFIGGRSAEVLGDYGAGPNHVLPTGGTARYTGGLSVFSFLRIRTWMRMDQGSPDLLADAAELAEIEGLEGHKNAATIRMKKS